MRTGSQKSSMETQRNHLIKVQFAAIHLKHVFSPHYFNKHHPPPPTPSFPPGIFFDLELGCFSFNSEKLFCHILGGVCFVSPGFLLLFCFWSINVIKRAEMWLGGRLKQAVTLSHYCSLAKAVQSSHDPEGN